MKKTFCDFCGEEIEKPEIKVTLNELEYDACMKCTNRLTRIAHYQEWKTQEPDMDAREVEDKPEEKDAERKEQKPEKPKRQQGERKERAIHVDHGKIVALKNAGWPVKEICAEMHVSPATVFNHLKMEKGNEEEQGM